ncbi:MAG: hypothetical protein ABIH66_10530 [bacterium]
MKLIKVLLKVIFVLHIVGAVGFLGYFFFKQEKFSRTCNACHEMRVHKKNLKLARHDNIECSRCHDQSPVYRMLWQKYFAGADKFGDVRVSNEKCSACHPHMEDTKVFYHDINFSHKTHLAEGEKCSTCHKQFVHRGSEKDPLLTLRQCRECHEEKRRHHTPPLEIVDTGELEKQPHDEDWYVEHKDVTEGEKQACAECHHPDFCSNCHNKYESHVAEWWANHYQEAMIRLAECQICHRPNYCISCHSKTVPVNHNEAWGMSHWVNSDLTTCNDCHTLNFCKACHTREMPTSHKTIKDHAGMEPERESLCNVCHGQNSCSTCHHAPAQDESCLGCHKDVLSATFKVDGKTLSHASHVEKHGVTCNSCHTEMNESGKYETLQNCGDCHHRTTARQCEVCHTRHQTEVDDSSMDFPCEFCHKQDRSDFGRPRRICLSCHALIFEQEAQVHGAISCVKCHAPHTWETQPDLSCRKCHERDMAKHEGMTGAKCTDCHSPHLWDVGG